MTAREKVAEAIFAFHSAGQDFSPDLRTHDEVTQGYWDGYADAAIAAHLDALKTDGYAVIKLPPEPTVVVNQTPSWQVLFGGEPEDIYPLGNGEIRISGFDDIPVDQVYDLVGALLAAARAEEAQR